MPVGNIVLFYPLLIFHSPTRVFDSWFLLWLFLGHAPPDEWRDDQNSFGLSAANNLDQAFACAIPYLNISSHQNVFILRRFCEQMIVDFSHQMYSWFLMARLRFEKPDDGLPVMQDWITCFESMLFSGVELQREPLDCAVTPDGGLVFFQYMTSWWNPSHI